MKRENIPYLYKVLPYGNINEEILNHLDGAGSPVYRPSTSSILEFQSRSDANKTLVENETIEERKLREANEAKQSLQEIYEQGIQFAGEDVVDIGNGKEIVIFSTGAASPHTVLRVPYEDFDQSFRSHAAPLGIQLQEGNLINGLQIDANGNKLPPKYMPLDMLVWTVVRDKKDNSLISTDLSDLTAPKTGDELVDQYRYALDQQPNKLKEIFVHVANRGELAKQTLMDVYNNIIRKDPLLAEILPEKFDKDILQGVVNGYFRKDAAKSYDQFYDDHRGKGPMSNSTLHFRYIAHLPLDVLNKLDRDHPGLDLYEIFDFFKAYPDFFGEEITIAPIRPERMKGETQGGILKKLFNELKYTSIDFVKLIDPYSSLAHKLLGNWLQKQLSTNYFGNVLHSSQLFEHHTSEFEHELRVSEGVEIILDHSAIAGIDKEQVIADSLSRVAEFMGQVLDPMWDRVNQYMLNKYRYALSPAERKEQLDQIMHDFQLPPESRIQIDSLQPTERQLKNILNKETEHATPEGRAKTERKIDKYQNNKAFINGRQEALWAKIEKEEATFEDFIEIITLEQYVQLFDDPKLNSGYNIPGEPGTATTYHFDAEGNFHLNIGWLLSMKGISELWLGAMVKRMEEKNQ